MSGCFNFRGWKEERGVPKNTAAKISPYSFYLTYLTYPLYLKHQHLIGDLYMSNEKRSFECVVEGQYHAASEVTGQPVLKNYRETFILPSQEAALSVICRHLLGPKLRAVKKDFIRFRTHQLVSITAHGRKPDMTVLQMTIDEMNVSQLSDFCILRGILIDPYKHGDLAKVKEQVAEMYRVKRQTAKDEVDDREAATRKEADALRALNQLPEESKELQININEQKATAAMNARAHERASGSGPVTSSLADVSRETVDPADEQLPPIEPDGANAASAADDIS